MHQALAILAIILAIALPLLDRVVLRPRRDEPMKPAERTMYLVFLAATALMALSSILMLAVGSSMHGWMLILHMTIAPLFACAIAAQALLWAERVTCLVLGVLISGFITIVSSMLMMMTWFGSDWQRCLLNTHRVASMILLIAAALQAGRLLLAGTSHAARTGD